MRNIIKYLNDHVLSQFSLCVIIFPLFLFCRMSKKILATPREVNS